MTRSLAKADAKRKLLPCETKSYNTREPFGKSFGSIFMTKGASFSKALLDPEDCVGPVDRRVRMKSEFAGLTICREEPCELPADRELSFLAPFAESRYIGLNSRLSADGPLRRRLLG